MTPQEYEDVRAHGRRFIVLPGHEVLDVERVVDERDRFNVVEKTGDSATLVEEQDPRAR